MYGTHLAYNAIQANDRVLDIGGWAQPFRRANVVLDMMPYDTRSKDSSFLMDVPQQFDEKTWIHHDVCDYEKPFPFKDKEFDFVVCGHVLEDIRNPFHVVREMQRVAKRGYIEVPTRFWEQIENQERKNMYGASHHRWFVDVRKNSSGQNELVFVFKNHLLHVDKRFQLKKPWGSKARPFLNLNYAVLGLFFEGEFNVYEDVSEAIGNSEKFMAETISLANDIGDKLWDQSEGFPVEVDLGAFGPGLHTLQDLQPKIKTKLLPYDLKGLRTSEILEYERRLIHE